MFTGAVVRLIDNRPAADAGACFVCSEPASSITYGQRHSNSIAWRYSRYQSHMNFRLGFLRVL